MLFWIILSQGIAEITDMVLFKPFVSRVFLTITEILNAGKLGQENNYNCFISPLSGETKNTLLNILPAKNK